MHLYLCSEVLYEINTYSNNDKQIIVMNKSSKSTLKNDDF